MPLDAAVARQFQAEGFLAPIPVLEPAEVRALRTRVDETLARPGRCADPRVHRHFDDPLTLQLCTLPALLAHIEALLGPDLLLWHSRYFDKPVGAPHIPWHQDAPFWPITPWRAMSAWIALDEADEANGCVHVLPGSQRKAVPHIGSSGTDRFGQRADPALVDDRNARPVRLQPGEALLFDCLLMHSSGHNPGPRSRLGLSIRYITPEVTVDHQRMRPRVPGYGVMLVRGEDRMGLNPVFHPEWADRQVKGQ